MERLTEKEAHQSLVELSLLGVSWHLPGVEGHTGKCWLLIKETLGELVCSGLSLNSPFLLLHGAQPVRPDGSPGMEPAAGCFLSAMVEFGALGLHRELNR